MEGRGLHGRGRRHDRRRRGCLSWRGGGRRLGAQAGRAGEEHQGAGHGGDTTRQPTRARCNSVHQHSYSTLRPGCSRCGRAMRGWTPEPTGRLAPRLEWRFGGAIWKGAARIGGPAPVVHGRATAGARATSGTPEVLRLRSRSLVGTQQRALRRPPEHRRCCACGPGRSWARNSGRYGDPRNTGGVPEANTAASGQASARRPAGSRVGRRRGTPRPRRRGGCRG